MGQKLYGRADVASAVRDASVRTGGQPEARQPRAILVLEGPAGTGKSALLDALAALLDRKVPHAYLNLATLDPQPQSSTVPQLLAAIAFELARRCGAYGTLNFPRLIIGHLVMSLELDPLNRQQARSQVAAMLGKQRGLDDTVAVLQASARQVLSAVPSLAGLPTRVVPAALSDRLIEFVVDRAARGRLTGGRLLGPYQQWYGDQDRSLGEHPLDVLVTLNRWAATSAATGAVSLRQVDRLMVAAFVADLQEGLAGLNARRRAYDPVLLVDNADTDLGRTLLYHLADHRRAAIQAGNFSHDPLVVVAASRGQLLADLGQGSNSPTLLRRPTGTGDLTEAAASWRRLPLRNLSADEVEAMVAALDLTHGSSRVLAASIYHFTAGHPSGTQQLLEGLAADDTAQVELRDVLRSRQSGREVETALLETLLSGTPADLVEHLITCAAARDRSDGLRLAVGTDALDPTRPELTTVGLWAPQPAGGTTLLRRLLLRRLAQRTDDHPWNWFSAHAWLAADSQDVAAAEDAALYYRLAGDQVETVARTLAERLPASGIAGWLSSVHAITQAPRRSAPTPNPGGGADPQGPADAPVAVARRLGSAVDLADQPLSAVCGLVASLWVVADPLCGNDRAELYWRIADQHREILRRGVRDGASEMAHEVQHYEKLAKSWEQPIVAGTSRPNRIDLSALQSSDDRMPR